MIGNQNDWESKKIKIKMTGHQKLRIKVTGNQKTWNQND